MKKTALILGIQGQDGALLAKYLLSLGYDVVGGARAVNDFSNWRLIKLGIIDQIKIVHFEINDTGSLKAILQDYFPGEIYLLAGNSKTYSSFETPDLVITESIQSVDSLLKIIMQELPSTRVFLAGSSEMFGLSLNNENLVKEDSPCFPTNPYGIGKLSSFHLGRIYRDFHNLYVVTGILFNHESWLRPKHFVTRKITSNLARLKISGGAPFTLGNIDIGRDWSDAEEIVIGMHSSLQAPESSDYVFSSGVITRVREFFTLAAKYVGFEPVFHGFGLEEKCICANSGKVIMKINPRHFRVLDTPALVGNSSRARIDLGWSTSSSIDSVVKKMVTADLERWKLGDVTH